MKPLIILAAAAFAAILHADPLAAPPRPFPPDVRAAVKAEAAKKWGTNYDMQQYELERQFKAMDQFNAARTKGMPPLPFAVSAQILKAAWNKWGVNFEMVMFEANNQAAAWKKLNGVP